MNSKPLKVAFVCNSGAASHEVATQFKQLAPYIQVLKPNYETEYTFGFAGKKHAAATIKQLSEDKPDIIFALGAIIHPEIVKNQAKFPNARIPTAATWITLDQDQTNLSKYLAQCANEYIKKPPRKIKVAFACQHGMFSEGVARYAKKMQREMPGVEVIGRGFGWEDHCNTLGELEEYKPDLIFYVLPQEKELLPGVKTIPGEEWSWKKTKQNKYAIENPKIQKEATRKLKKLGVDELYASPLWTKTTTDTYFPRMHIAMAIQAKNWLRKNGYLNG